MNDVLLWGDSPNFAAMDIYAHPLPPDRPYRIVKVKGDVPANPPWVRMSNDETKAATDLTDDAWALWQIDEAAAQALSIVATRITATDGSIWEVDGAGKLIEVIP